MFLASMTHHLRNPSFVEIDRLFLRKYLYQKPSIINQNKGNNFSLDHSSRAKKNEGNQNNRSYTMPTYTYNK